MRERLVRPRDARLEASLVATLALVILGAACLRALPTIVQREAQQRVAAYQVPEGRLAGDAALVYRTLAAAIADTTALHGQSRRWPGTATLAAAGVPPFAPATLPAALRGMSWTAHDHGSWVDYAGHDAGTNQAFILRVIDLHAGYHPHPHPGQDYDPVQRTAAQVWWFPNGLRGYPGERIIEAGGQWIVREPG